METFSPNQRVTVSQKQRLLNNSSVITAGEFISATGNTAMVLLEGEEVPREVPLDAVSDSASSLGNISSRRGEASVIDMSPRRSY